MVSHAYDDDCFSKQHVERQVAKEGALGVAVRSIYVYAENRNVLQQLFWLLNELILDQLLNGDKAMNFFQAARRRNKKKDDEDDHVKIPTRLERRNIVSYLKFVRS